MKLTFIKKVVEARGTKSFFFEPEKDVRYQAGQYYYLTFPKLNYPDPRGTTRHFTLSSSPTEGKSLRITTRIRPESGFKKTLDELATGAVIEGEGPSGTFILDEAEKLPQIFIAGGIGITPFRSIIKNAIDKNLQTPLYLVYSNSDSDFTFGNELQGWAGEHGFLKIEFFDTSKSGHLTQIKIRELIEHWAINIGSCTFWVVGPPPMVDAVEQVLEAMGVASNKLKIEKFTGY